MSAYDFEFKLILLGDEGVQKSAIIKRYCFNIFDPSERLTIGVEFYSKLIELKKKKIKLQIWNVGGEERFRFLLPTYCLGADAAFLLYDITKPQTLENISEWIKFVRKKAGNIPIMLLGTKLDLAEDQREVSTKQGKLIAKKYNFSVFVEVSAKTGENVDLAFQSLVGITLANAMRRKDKKKEKAVRTPLPSFPSTPDPLDNLLKKLLAAIPEIDAAAIVSTEGLPIAIALHPEVDETKIAAMVAALHSLAKKAIGEIQRGDFEQLYIRGSDGYLLILPAGPNAVLVISADKNVRLGSILRGFKDDRFPGTPFPYIFNPPNPPDDLEGAVQTQKSRVRYLEGEEIIRYCKHCGAPLDEGVSVCPNCKKLN